MMKICHMSFSTLHFSTFILRPLLSNLRGSVGFCRWQCNKIAFLYLIDGAAVHRECGKKPGIKRFRIFCCSCAAETQLHVKRLENFWSGNWLGNQGLVNCRMAYHKGFGHQAMLY